MGSAIALLAAVPAIAQNTSTDHQRLGREVLKELIETNTTLSSGSVTAAAERMAARLVSAGFPQADVQVVGGAEKKRNLVARYRGNGARKPILFIAHLDVVEARREDWSFDPFVLTEQDGYFYGRGTLDVKGGAATLVAAFVRLRQERWVPDRDLILALTADEEGGSDNGVSWLLANRRDLVEAEYSINVDTGGGELRSGTLTALDVQAAEKVRLVHADGEKRGRPQLAADERQRHLSARGRPGAPGGVRVPGASERHDARVFWPHGGFPFRTGERGGYARGFERGAQPRRCRAAECEVSLLQRVAAYDVRRDRAPGRSCRERVATDRPGDSELPAASGRKPGNGAADARARSVRSADRGRADWNADAKPPVSPRP